MIAAVLLALLPQTYATPESQDTVGYWQQRADYRVVARLDERRGVLVAEATLTYRNNSPDTLREMYVHQHLNAFRPGSQWSRRDEREGRERFQRLRDPDYAYERFTAAPTVDGVSVTPDYPGAPDSTVARFRLPRPLAPGDSAVVAFAWEARPSTLPRRQGRRGRTFDFAQWYPKVAVYDRRGWEPNALIPAGEFYGEFGDWDVTLIVPSDQVIGATGVPVEGDPGWTRAARWGSPRPAAEAYGAAPERSGSGTWSGSVPAGAKVVRFVARGVHHFAFSLSPDYRYEGGTYVREAGPAPGALRFAPFDTVSVHVLYKPGDEREWGGGKVVERTRNTLAWLERVYGAYGYPQMTVLHRIEPGGTEFPMMQMNGSASQGLNLHEGGHVYSYGLLASNEWQSGWMDEGLTSYQTSWAQGLTRHDRVRRRLGLPPQPLAVEPPRTSRDTFYLPAYRALALRPSPDERSAIEQHRLALLGRMQPIGIRADSFSEFGVYNAAVYTRAEMMYGALRDAIGDEAFARFLRDYYARWAFRHVDEAAMRASAERACGCELGWFFRQWVHRVGAIDYALRRVRTERRGDRYVTRVRVVRVGDYLHPMPVGVRIGDQWSIVRTDPTKKDQTLDIETGAPPAEVRLDPLRTTEDWFRPNDFVPGRHLVNRHWETVRLERPFLNDTLPDRFVTTVLPFAWYSTPGGVTPAVRLRSSYQGWARKTEVGLGLATRGESGSGDEPFPPRLQFWAVSRDTLVGHRQGAPFNAGAWWLDDLLRVRFTRAFDRSRIVMAPRTRRGGVVVALDGYEPRGKTAFDTLRWGRGSVEAELGVWGQVARVDTMMRAWRIDLSGGIYDEGVPDTRGYYRAEYEGRAWRRTLGGRVATLGRVYAAATPSRTPPERRVYASSQRPIDAFGNHYLRPAGAPLAPSDPTDSRLVFGDWYAQLGGAGLRGYHQLVTTDLVAAANGEVSLALLRIGPPARPLRLEANAFADVAAADGVRLEGAPGVVPDDERVLGDAGLGLAVRGWLFDRAVRLRADVPLYVRQPALAVGARAGADESRARVRFAFSLADLW